MTGPSDASLADRIAADRGWIVARPSGGHRWGGEVRRQHVFARLAERTDATVIERWPLLRRRIVGRRWQLWRRAARPATFLVSAEQVPPSWIGKLPELAIPIAVAIYDDPAAQLDAFGIRLTRERRAELVRRRALNVGAFHSLVVPTASFAELTGLPRAQVIVGGNGTVAGRVTPAPWPTRPSIGMVSGAAPGRGIELLVEAARRLRADVPDLELWLWLVAPSDESAAYLTDLRRSVADAPWIRIGPAPYARLGSILGRAGVLVIPHPPNSYMDVALPVKLFDSMAAGRPLVVTPRLEMAAVVRRHDAGLVAAGDTADDLADACRRLLDDGPRARRLGEAGREAAMRHYDWPAVGARIAGAVLAREGLDGSYPGPVAVNGSEPSPGPDSSPTRSA